MGIELAGNPDLSGPVIKDQTLDYLYEQLLAAVRLPEDTVEESQQLISELEEPTSARARHLDTLTRSIELFKMLVDALRLCRNCTMRHTPTNHARYCYVTCHSGNHPAILDPDPDGTLRRLFENPPTIENLLAQVVLKEQNQET